MVEFGRCRLDVAARELWRDGERVHLEPQAFDLLAFLVDQRARVVPKAEILDAVWGDQFVSESALTTRVKEIRHAVGDDGRRQEVVANVRGRGYRFVATVLDRRPPGAPDDLVGRSRDLDEVRLLLRPGAVVTVVGPGGVGKTTLALAVCRSLDPPPLDGVVLVELAELAEPGAVVAAVAHAAAVAADERDIGLLARTLAPLDAVLLLDNCEHVVAGAARLANRLLELGGHLRVLATSRERLGVAGERVWPLLPLGRTDASELFVRRARAVVPSFSVDGGEEDLQAVLTALDDLPLAIEMAAARVTSSSLAELRADVEANRAELRSPDRSSPPRHRTLDAVVSWSADRLTGDERLLFTQLSAFAGPVRFEDVRQMLGDPPGLRSRLAELVDRNLVVAEPGRGETRFRMLETVRAVAVAGTDRALSERHARWAVRAAAEGDTALRTADEGSAAARLAELSAELRAAQRWAVLHDHGLAADLLGSVHRYAYWRLWPEPATWARDLLARDPADGDVVAVAAAVVAGDAANRARLEDARRFARLAYERGGPAIRAAALEVLADVELYEGRYGEVGPVVAELRRIGESAGDAHLVAIALVDAALASIYGGFPERAEPNLAELDEMRPQLAPSDAAWATYARAELSSPSEAVGLLGDVVALASSVGNHLLVSVGQDSLGAALCRTGRLDEAAAVLEECLLGFLRHAHYTQTAPAVLAVVELLERRGDEQGAAALASELHDLTARAASGAGAGLDRHRELFLAAVDAMRRHGATG